MKTSVMDVHDMLSVLSVVGVEQRLGEVPGVESVTVNFAAGNATVRFDETRLDLADIKSDVRQRGFDADAQSKEPTPDGHEDRAAPVAPTPPPDSPAAAAEGNASPAKTAADRSVKTP